MVNRLNQLAAAVAFGACSVSANAFVVNDSFSGNWADQGSRGLIIDVFSQTPDDPNRSDFANNILVEWFTYRDGQPLWLIGQSAVNKNTQTAEIEFLEFSGGVFGPEGTGSPAFSTWGNGTLQFLSCNTATLEFSGDDGAGTIELSNLTPKDSCVVRKEFESCPSFSTPIAQDGFCVIEGEISQDVTLTNEINWLIQGKVTVNNGASLTIEPGTEIIGGTSGSVDFLVVDLDSKIYAEGTPNAPIIMRGFDSVARGEWGGLTINGRAPINGCVEGTEVCQSEGEGESGLYGGNDPMDSSGIVRYLVVANAGFEFSPANELNGIALQGVGAGTVFEFVQSHLASDDAIEPFGGTVNMRNLVLTGASDDSYDWVLGYKGNTQYVVVKKYSDTGDRGIESDNLNADNDSLPRSNPRLANFTMIGTSAASQGVLHRRGTAGQMANFVITGFGGTCVDIDNEATWLQAQAGELLYQNSVAGGCDEGTFDTSDFAVDSWWLDAGNIDADPMLGGPDGTRLMPGSPAIGIGVVPFEDAFFDKVDFAGAFSPNGADWTAGWTVGLDRDVP